MARTGKSYRTVVGMLENKRSDEPLTFVLDTNESSEFYGFFAVTSNMSGEATRYALDYIEDKIEPFSDKYRNGELTKPAAFVKEILSELFTSMEKENLTDGEAGKKSVSIALFKDNAMVLARVNECPMFILKDRKLKAIFKAPKDKTSDVIQIDSFTAADGEVLILGSEKNLKNITPLELRNAVQSEQEPKNAAKKIHSLANKYETTTDPRLLVIKIKKNKNESSSLFSGKNIALAAAMSLFIVLLFLWGDALRSSHNWKYMTLDYWKSRIVSKHTPRGPGPKSGKHTFEIEPVFDKLAVPYDLAIGRDGDIFVVDDSQEKIIHYSPKTKKMELIGNGLNLSFPTGIALTQDRLYVADFSRSVNRIFALKNDGSPLFRIPGSKSGPVALNNPKAIETADDNIYVCDRGNNRVLVFDSEGKPTRTINLPQILREPNGIAVAKNGTIYISLKLTGAIATINAGDKVERLNLSGDSTDDSKLLTLSKPSGIAVDSLGDIYIADTGQQRIVIVDKDGRLLNIIDKKIIPELENYYPMSVKIDPRGDFVYIVAANRYKYDVTNKEECRGKIWKIRIN